VTDLSTLSDADLQALYSQTPIAAPTPDGSARLRVTPHEDLSRLSDEELKAAYAQHEPSWKDTAIDVAKSAGSGLVKGAISLAGMPADLKRNADWALDKYVTNPLLRATGQPELPPMESPVMKAMGSDSIRQGVESVTGPLHEPETKTGKYVETAAEFVPTALSGPGGVVRKVVLQAVAPGIASEAAGQALEGTPYETVGRIVGGVAGGLAGAAVNGPATAERALAKKLPDGITGQQFDQAQTLLDRARAHGVNLTGPEALSEVTGKNVLLDQQRLAESSGRTRPVMDEFLNGRSQAFDNAARGEIDRTLGQGTANPSMIGPEASKAAESTLNDVRAAINRATKPSYDAAGQTLVPPSVHAIMRDDPLFVDALDAVRNNPAKNAFVRGHSDRSVAVYDAVKKELAERAENASNPVQPGHSQAVASVTGNAADTVKQVAIAADKAAAGGPNATSAYEQALKLQADLRRKYLEPLQRGPLGKMANQAETNSAIEALFPSNPVPGSSHEVSTAVKALDKRNPWAARQLVRAYVEKSLNQSMKKLQGGSNEYGPANFSKMLAGEAGEGASLEAAVRALPQGDARWEGLHQLLEIASATGKRQRKGSLTAFNEPELQSLGKGGPISEMAKRGLSPGKWWNLASDVWSSWQLGKHLDDIASIVTDPRSAEMLRKLATLPVRSREAEVIAIRLTAQQKAQADNQSFNAARKP
jgi:hypothetical protein